MGGGILAQGTFVCDNVKGMTVFIMTECVVEGPYFMMHKRAVRAAQNQELGYTLQRRAPIDLLQPARPHFLEGSEC